ncbi:transmembrane protein 272-like [Scomber scombrus]|uniref:Transmembrane protein 272-like n=1 Tax=Scomber scombrus TaxID=13677 RepID=A0AAV1N113_SCOSC
MAAPSESRPVTVTFGAVWRLQLDPQTSRPPRLSVCAKVAAVILARTIFGVVYLKDCPQQPNIPIYLLGLALVHLIMIPFMNVPRERDTAQPYVRSRFIKPCLQLLVGLSSIVWILAGSVWVFSIYKPNYDPAAADGLYCNKTLYTFAFWNVVWELFSLFVVLAILCKGLLCYMVITPVPTQREFYGNV